MFYTKAKPSTKALHMHVRGNTRLSNTVLAYTFLNVLHHIVFPRFTVLLFISLITKILCRGSEVHLCAYDQTKPNGMVEVFGER